MMTRKAGVVRLKLEDSAAANTIDRFSVYTWTHRHTFLGSTGTDDFCEAQLRFSA